MKVTAEKELPPFPLGGITLEGMKDFITTIGGESLLLGLSTQEVCEKFVKPLTEVGTVLLQHQLQINLILS